MLLYSVYGLELCVSRHGTWLWNLDWPKFLMYCMCTYVYIYIRIHIYCFQRYIAVQSELCFSINLYSNLLELFTTRILMFKFFSMLKHHKHQKSTWGRMNTYVECIFPKRSNLMDWKKVEETIPEINIPHNHLTDDF